MAILDRNTRWSLHFYKAEELIHTINWDVRDDLPALDGVSKDFVRQHFRKWVLGPATAQETEGEDAFPVWRWSHGYRHAPVSRYRYCVYVDEDVLRSVLDADDGIRNFEGELQGYLDVLDAEWEPPTQQPETNDSVTDQNDGEDEVYDPVDDGEEPVDGCKLYNVGWMRIESTCLMPTAYAMFNIGAWHINYQRPPTVVYI